MAHPGTTIREVREAQELSVRQLGAMSRVNPSYISQIERGKKNPSDRVLAALARALGINLDEGAAA